MAVAFKEINKMYQKPVKTKLVKEQMSTEENEKLKHEYNMYMLMNNYDLYNNSTVK